MTVSGPVNSNPPFQFEFLPAAEDLAGYVNTLFTFRTDLEELSDILPAYSAQLCVFAAGSASMEFPGGLKGQSSDAFFIAPLQEAAPFVIKGPVRAAGVSLTPLGWAALSGLPADTHGNRALDVVDVLAADVAAEITDLAVQLRAGAIDQHGMAGRLADIIRPAMKPVAPDHVRLIARVQEWLNADFNPQVADLAASVPYSDRQLQRLTRRFFGRPPVGLITRYRAIRAATLLSQPQLAPALQQEIINAYFDQAHLIHDIRRYTGRTPTLLEPRQSVGAKTLGPEGYGVIDLFAGGNGEDREN